MNKTTISSLWILTLLLQGCMTSGSMNNNLVSISPQNTPSNLQGIWTGSIPPWLVSFKINKNGTGIYCYSNSIKDGLQKIKHANNTIFIQDGSELEIKSISNDRLTLQAPYMGVKEYVLYKDNSLDEASIFCQDKF